MKFLGLIKYEMAVWATKEGKELAEIIIVDKLGGFKCCFTYFYKLEYVTMLAVNSTSFDELTMINEKAKEFLVNYYGK